MRLFRAVTVTGVVLLLGLTLMAAQSWTPLTDRPKFLPSNPLLLGDGRVLAHDESARDWWALTPDINGSYLNGKWSQLASLPKGYAPFYFASAVLPDSRVVVIGGEYNNGQPAWTTLGAIYSPKTNTWKVLKAPAGWSRIGDAQSVVLPNGTFMLAACCTAEEALLDSKTLKWTATGTGKADINDEEGWTLLPNGKVLTVDTNNSDVTNSEIYDPATGSWTSAGSTIVQLDDTKSHEIGPSILRPDGTVLWTGATGHNAVYDTITSTWSAAPDFPIVGGRQLDIADGPAALLPSGNVLLMASPGVYGMGAHFYEWDGFTFAEVPGTPDSAHDSSYFGNMLVLPTGQILFTDTTLDVELYSSTGSPDPSWAPAITKVATQLTRAKTYVVKGTQFNGLSQGAAYGDDVQAASNYPVVRITNAATGHVFYCFTYKPSSMGVATGSLIVSAHFTVPAKAERGASQLEVVTNGIASAPVSVTVN
jgi:hypothetical protein